MAKCVCAGALLECSFGTAPMPMIVLPTNRVLEGAPGANIMDNKPFVNITPFILCKSLLNPTVAAATTAAAGVLTPMPCIPVIPAPWIPTKPTVLLAGSPILLDNSKAFCAYAGVISVKQAGQFTAQT
jgi:hypothetical protein